MVAGSFCLYGDRQSLKGDDLMVKAELVHNPYLLLTKAEFNGQEPRINSQIEKYETRPLKDWVHKVPEIFYNEMNGYDFDFYFTGTKPDFEAVREAFVNAGVTPDQVRLFHKNELEDADCKSEEIGRLISWLQEHPDRRFDFEEFRARNPELFDRTCPLVILNGDFSIDMGPSVSVEKVNSACELQNTNLKSIPVLCVVEASDLTQFRKDLVMLLSRADVRQEQLFFMIDPRLEEHYVVRIISDLGVRSPQIVRSSQDEGIKTYLVNYPVTEYIRNAVRVFSEMTDHISGILEGENKESAVAGAGIREQLDELEADLEKLHEAQEFFAQRDHYEPPQTFAQVRQSLEEQLMKWKNRKTKILGEEEAKACAGAFSAYIHQIYADFSGHILAIYEEKAKEIESDFSAVYVNGAGREEDISPEAALQEISPESVPDLTEKLLEKQHISYEEAKTDFFSLFKKDPEETMETVRVSACYLDEWRQTAAELVMPAGDRLIRSCQEGLLAYYEALAEACLSRLDELAAEKQAVKDRTASRLSEDERMLQEDNDWLAEVRHQLQVIERG